jgi:hypothetical protein
MRRKRLSGTSQADQQTARPPGIRRPRFDGDVSELPDRACWAPQPPRGFCPRSPNSGGTVRSISRRIAEVGLGDKQAILDQYAGILRLRSRLASTAPEDKAWTRDALDVRNRFTFDCAEWAGDELIRTHSNAGDNCAKRCARRPRRCR